MQSQNLIKTKMNLAFKLTIGVLFLLTTSLVAQDVEVTFGPVLKDPSKTYLNEMLGQSGDEIYFTRYERGRKGGMFIEIYDSKLNLKSSHPIIKPNDDLTYHKVFLIDGKLYAFLNFLDKKNDEVSLLATTLTKDGKLDNAMIELGKLEVKSRRSSGTFDVDTSSGSGGKTFLVFESPAYEKTENEKFNFLVYDLNFKLKQKIVLTLPYLDKDFSVKDYILDAKGNIHLLASVELKSEEKERGKSNYEYRVLSYFTANDELKEYQIDMKQDYLSEIKMKVNTSGDLLLSGFYSDKGMYGMKGVFFVKIGVAQQKVVKQTVTEFSKDFLELFMSERRAEKGKELTNYYVDKIVPKEDGGIIMVSEYYRYYQTCFTDQNGNTRCTNHYNYDDIVVVNFDPEGKVIWWTKVPKRQHTVNDGGYMSGYAMAVAGDKLFFIFNDNVANLEITDPLKYKNMSTPKKAVTTLVTLSEKGEMTRSVLFNTKENKCIMRPKFHLQSSESELIMYADRWSSYMLARIKFE